MRRYAVWAFLATLFAAACGEANPPTASIPENAAISPAVAAPDEQGYLNAHVHVMPPKAQNWDAFAKPGAAPGGGTGIFYHGGPIIKAPSVAAIYWGTSTIYSGGPAPGTTGSGSQDGSLVGFFLRNLGGSSYFNINTDYYDTIGNGNVTNVLGYTGFWADNTNATGSAPSDAAIQAEVVRAFTGNKLAYNASTVYLVFTGSGVNLGGGFGSQYCAYHGHFSWNGNQVKYAAQPYNYDFPSGCSALSGSPNNDFAADAEVNTLAHETEEATTDPQLNAWYDRRGYENADKCAWTFGTTYTTSNGAKANMSLGGKNFLIQHNWLNRGSGGCSLGF
jgi:hypothetical protein